MEAESERAMIWQKVQSWSWAGEVSSEDVDGDSEEDAHGEVGRSTCAFIRKEVIERENEDGGSGQGTLRSREPGGTRRITL